MGFVDAVVTCFARFFDFRGRAARPEFWWWVVFSLLVGLVLGQLVLFGLITPLVSNIVPLGLLVPTVAVTVRRLHDMDCSGWWALLGLVPVVGVPLLLLWLTLPGSDRTNRFEPAWGRVGPRPKGRFGGGVTRPFRFGLYALQRISHAAVFLLLLFGLLIFVLDQAPATGLLGQSATPEALDALRRQMGFDRSLAQQFVDGLSAVLQGDFGVSIGTGRSVSDMIAERYPNTVLLVVMSSVVAVPIALLVASMAARNAVSRPLILALAQLSPSMPAFVPGIVLIAVFAIQLGWLPTFAYRSFDGPLTAETLTGLVLPVAAVVLSILGNLIAVGYADLTEGQESGGGPLTSGLPVAAVSVTGQSLGLGFGAAVIVELVFVVPGIGQLLVNGVALRDPPVLLGCAMIVGATLVAINLLTDLAQHAIDPTPDHADQGALR